MVVAAVSVSSATLVVVVVVVVVAAPLPLLTLPVKKLCKTLFLFSVLSLAAFRFFVGFPCFCSFFYPRLYGSICFCSDSLVHGIVTSSFRSASYVRLGTSHRFCRVLLLLLEIPSNASDRGGGIVGQQVGAAGGGARRGGSTFRTPNCVEILREE